MLGRLLITAAVTFLSWFQSPAAPSSAPLIVPQLERGTIQGNTYRNSSIGLELTADPSLKFQSAELKNSGTKSEWQSASALGKPRSGKAREGTSIGVVALAAYPESERSTDSCVRRIAESQHKLGFKRAKDSSSAELGHTTFARADFVADGPVYQHGPSYEAMFIKACDALAIVIVYSGSDQDMVERFIGATDLKLDPAHSGCHSELVP